MAVTVAKFGGSSLGNNELLMRAASEIKKETEKGNFVAVVVSARGKTTDELIKNAGEISGKSGIRKCELDKLLSTGELASAAYFAMALESIGIPSESFSGRDAGILTDSNFSDASIIKVNPERILECFKNGKTAVIAGFQGADGNNNITTLGRGGSDTTAVAVAAALSAEKCLIYTDVDGVYTCDPRKVENAKKYDCISFSDMLEYSRLGAKILSFESAEFAFKYRVPVYILSSEKGDGTVLCENTSPIYSKAIGVTSRISGNKSAVSVVCAEDTDVYSAAATAIHCLSENAVEYGNISYTKNSFTVTVHETDVALTEKLIHGLFF